MDSIYRWVQNEGYLSALTSINCECKLTFRNAKLKINFQDSQELVKLLLTSNHTVEKL